MTSANIVCPYCGAKYDLSQSYKKFKLDGGKIQRAKVREKIKERRGLIWRGVSADSKTMRDTKGMIPFPQQADSASLYNFNDSNKLNKK